MAELHIVGVTDDGRHLLLASAPTGSAQHRLAADSRLMDAVRAASSRPGQASSALTPREIQAELRDGASLDDVAARAGVSPERLEPYARPVLSELTRVLEDALSARISRPPHGASVLPLGLAVRAQWPGRLAEEQPRWSARRDPAAGWVVEVRLADEAGPALARWRWDRVARSLAPLDAVASQLGHATALTESPERAPSASSASFPAAPPGPGPPPAAATAEQEAGGEQSGGPDTEPAQRVARGRAGRRPAVPAWADVLLGVSAGGPPRTEDSEAAG